MGLLLRVLFRRYLLKRLFRALGGGRAGRSGRHGGYVAHRSAAHRPRVRSRGGLLPFPHYSTRTRRGTRVSVGGCCLPVPLGMLSALGAAYAGWRRLR